MEIERLFEIHFVKINLLPVLKKISIVSLFTHFSTKIVFLFSVTYIMEMFVAQT